MSKSYTPKEVIDLYLEGVNMAMLKARLSPNENYSYMVDTLRDLQKNMENNKMVIIEDSKL